MVAPSEDTSLANYTTNVAEANQWQPRAANNHDAHDMGLPGTHIEGTLSRAFSLSPHASVSEGNTFHVPPFRCLAETAGAGGFHLSSPPIIPARYARYDSGSHP